MAHGIVLYEHKRPGENVNVYSFEKELYLKKVKLWLE